MVENKQEIKMQFNGIDWFTVYIGDEEDPTYCGMDYTILDAFQDFNKTYIQEMRKIKGF